MAQLDVQRKRKGSVFIWIIFAIIAIAVAVLLFRGCNKSAPLKLNTSDTTKKDTAKMDSNVIVTTEPDWNAIDFTIPRLKYDEVTDTAIVVKGNDKYTIYSLGENVLFAADKSTLQPAAEAKLKQIAESLARRYKMAEIAVYGHTDSAGTAGANKQLGEDRANVVKNWLSTKADIVPDKISIHSLGEQKPLATNATEKGRAQNRSVEIVAYAEGEK
ncbi:MULTISPECIES: OmpA family protein [unclassified Mucilaginibacter]|uniref:OmpA family protein n=1 Tax=unclassified Mucilaginibacter TaxID=2617802 RepID=UPI002AC91538|nr:MULTISPECIES: OmpA family protein [unclassified Mucilaginibacter]MEB0261229.1 OmpA family protein [Mucilaginibacter sp. 10I4]MEB0279053.1 OmpA family protein [Mucilaginibacter sp. 10B2]MEB0299928.1 OmpA family protein [Mucilaginibacter sp. 5C4]WPX22231.1 OmpA family protein [Mucilaginibacter sp. 5C4]